MHTIPVEYGLLLSAALFSIGLIGLIARKNIVFMLMSIEIMFNAAGLAFIVGGMRWNSVDGQIMFLFILAIAAAEVAVGLGLVFLQDRLFGKLDADVLNSMRK